MKTDFNFPLSAMTPGSEAVIVSLDAAGPIGRRLQDLGLLPGTRVQLIRRAPLGDPSIYELRGYRLCLRRSECAQVMVRAVALPKDEAPETSEMSPRVPSS
jgi:Fe2+ transport system protein FeoA